MLGSFLNGIALVGGPAEVYYFGIIGIWGNIALLIVPVITAHITVPMFHKMKITSAYEVDQKFSFVLQSTIHHC